MNLTELTVVAAVSMFCFSVWFLVSSARQRRRKLEDHRLAADEDGNGEGRLLLANRVPEGGLAAWWWRLIQRTGLDLYPATALAIVVLCGTLLGGFVFLWRLDVEPWLALPAFVVGAAVPLAFFWWRQGRWRRTLQAQLPDALFLLARSLRAGRSLEHAIQLVGEQGTPPLAREFARMYRQIELGIPMEQVVRGTADRLGLIDFNVFASVLSLHRGTGGNLPLLLDRLAATTRDRNQFEGQYRAATVLGRTSAAFIASMVVLILLYFCFFQREWFVRFFDTSESYIGVVLFCTAMALEAAGLALMYFLLKYDY
jgi:tight adherence protein B